MSEALMLDEVYRRGSIHADLAEDFAHGLFDDDVDGVVFRVVKVVPSEWALSVQGTVRSENAQPSDEDGAFLRMLDCDRAIVHDTGFALPSVHQGSGIGIRWVDRCLSRCGTAGFAHARLTAHPLAAYQWAAIGFDADDRAGVVRAGIEPASELLEREPAQLAWVRRVAAELVEGGCPALPELRALGRDDRHERVWAGKAIITLCGVRSIPMSRPL
jgi:hypothetical protein